MSRGAEGTVSPQFFFKYLSTGCRLSTEVMHRAGEWGVIHRAKQRLPQVLSTAPVCIILPNKKYTLK
jgi:hypothetical protein